MANTVIQLKKSGTPSASPVSLANGELAINYADGKLFYKDVLGNIQEISGGGGGPFFGTINVAGTLVVPDIPGDVLGVLAGTNIELTPDIINDAYTITANLKPAFDVANAAFNSANNVAPQVTPAFNVANAAFAKANAALPNTTGAVFNGNLNIKTDLWIGNNISNVTSLIFNTSTNRTPGTPGELTWSQDDSTLHFDTDTPGNVILHIGQDLAYYVKNQSGQTIYKGNVCMFAGTLGASGRLTVQRAIANNAYPSKYVMGVAAADILNGNDGFVISQGKIRGINTSAFSQGDILYLSPTNPGQMQNTMPTAPNNKVTIAAVIYSDNINGSIQVRPTYGSKINEDELAELNGLTNGDVLAYVSSNGRFENKNTLFTAFNTINAAFGIANTALQNTSGTFGGNLTVAGAANVTSLYSNTYIDFDKLPYNTTLAPYREGRVWFNNDTKTLQIDTDYSDFNISVGEREWIRVRNSSGATIAKGKPVYVTGVHIPGHPIHGHHPTVALANAGSVTKREVIGLAGHDIPDGSHGFVVVRGYIEGINTAALTTGSRVHLGYASDGDLIPYAPEYPNYPMDVGICLTSNTTNGTMYVQIFDHSFERLRVDQSARFGGDVTIEGDFFVLGTTTIVSTSSQSYGAQYIYMGTEDTINNSAITFTGSGLNDLDFVGQYNGSTTNYYVKITEANATGDYFSWSYDNFATVEAANTLISYQTPQYLSNGISVYFQANTGHTIGNKWNASATYVSADFGIIGNHNDGGTYTHAGMFRDATDGTFKFFRSYRPEPNSNIDISNTTFALGNVQVDTITANIVSVSGINVGGTIPLVFNVTNSAYTVTNAAFGLSNNVYAAVNSAFAVINAAYTAQNSDYTSSNAAYVVANAAFGHSNTTYGAVNSAFAVINAAFGLANTKTYTFTQNTAPATANNDDLWVNSDTGVVYENFGNTTNPIWAEFGPTGVAATSAPGTGTFTDITASGNVTVGKQIFVTYTPAAATNAAVEISSSNTKGGIGYADVLKLTNIGGGISNPTKWIRINNTGNLEVVNSAYNMVSAYLTDAGNLTTAGVITPGAWSAGQVIKDVMLDNSQLSVLTTTVATSTSDTDFISYSYTPVSTSSYLVIHMHVGEYSAGATGGTGTDSYFSRIKVDGAEITYSKQYTRDSYTFRTGALFPLTGRYTNSSTAAKTITVAVRRDTADDNITIANSATALWMRITEIAR